MLIVLNLLLSCNSPAPAASYQQLTTSQHCASSEDKDSCRVKECTDFYQRAIPPQPVDAQALSDLCSLSAKSSTESALSCGLPACILLPRASSQQAIQQLTQGYPKSFSQKTAKQAVFRGLLQHPEQLTSFVENNTKTQNWIGIAASEAMCQEASIAKRFKLPCGKPNPKAALAAYDLGAKQYGASTHAAFSLAASLSTKTTMPRLLALAINSKEPVEQRKAALTAIQSTMAKGYKIDPSLQQTLQQSCQKREAVLMAFCNRLSRP